MSISTWSPATLRGFSFRAGVRNPHGIYLETIQSANHRGIIPAKLPAFGFVRHLQNPHTEGSVGRHHGTVDQQFARVKLSLAIGAMLRHQSSLLVRDVVRKG